MRGVAPITFAGLLVFGLAPLLGLRLTQWLSGTQSGAAWVLSGPGLYTGFILIALPMGLLAWWRLKALARRYEAKRFSDAQLLAGTWWLLIVASEAVERISAFPGVRPLLRSAGGGSAVGGDVSAAAGRGAAPRPARPANGRRRARCCCCACSATPRAPRRCSTASPRAGAGSAR